MKAFISFCKNMDFFGDSFTFRVKSKRTYTSVVGGLFSILFCICSIIYLTNGFINWLNKKDFVKDFEIKQISEATLNFTQHQYFSIGFCLRNKNMLSDSFLLQYFDFSLFMVEKEVYNKTLRTSLFPLTLNNCNNEHFKNINQEILQNIDLNNCGCYNFTRTEQGIALKNGENRVILRSYSDILLQQELQFKLKLKREVITDQARLSEVNTYLSQKDSKLSIYIPDYSMNINNISHPMNIHLKKLYYKIKPMSSQSSEVKLSQVFLKDYTSLFDYSCKF